MTLTETLNNLKSSGVTFVYIGCSESSGFFYMGDIEQAEEQTHKYSVRSKKRIKERIAEHKRALASSPRRIALLKEKIEDYEDIIKSDGEKAKKKDIEALERLRESLKYLIGRQERLPALIEGLENEHANYTHLEKHEVTDVYDRTVEPPLGKIIIIKGGAYCPHGAWFVGDEEGEYIYKERSNS